MLRSPWAGRAAVVLACVGMGPPFAAGFPWRAAGTGISTRPGLTRRNPGTPSGSAPTITAAGDRLVITGDDPKQVELAYELARMLLDDKSQSHRAFRLEYARATDLAQVLDEWFNGPPAPRTQAPVPSMVAALLAQRSRGGRSVPPPEPPKPPKPRVHIVADATTNSLLVRGNALELMTAQRLVKDLDVEPEGSNASMKPFVIGPLQYAVATEVVRLLKEVYQESTDQTRGRSGRGRPRPQPLDPSGRAKPVALSVTADDRTNTIIGMAPEAMAADIRRVVGVIEDRAKVDDKVVQLVPAQGIDPTLLQQVVDAIQYRPPAAQAPARGTPTVPATRPGLRAGR